MLGAALRRVDCRHRARRYRDRSDVAEIAWLRELLDPGRTAVDIGAYKGGYSYWMRDAVGDSGRVFAFEPQPELGARLERTVAAFDWRNVEVRSVALSDTTGVVDIHVPGRGPSRRASIDWERPGARVMSVPRSTLDAEFLDSEGTPHPAFIKCDVEGHEMAVLRGARRTLETARPTLLVECENRHNPSHSVRDVVAFLESLGYSASFFFGDERLPADRFDPAVHQDPSRRPYGNNFAFEPG